MQINVTPKKTNKILEVLGQLTLHDKIIADELTDDQLLTVAGLFPYWQPNESVEAHVDIRNFQGQLYECIQSHTTQSDWYPPNVPALWVLKRESGVIAEWVQPPAENPYMIGDKVLFEGSVYESLINNNVWSPSAYPAGWEIIL